MKNWVLLRENIFVSLFIFFISIFFLALLKYKVINNENNILLQFLVGFIILSLPVMLSKLYLKLSQKENHLLITLMSKSELIKVKQTQSIISHFTIFFFFIILGLFPKFKGITKIVFFTSGILFLLITGYVLPLFRSNNHTKFKKVKNNRLWNLKLSAHNAFPIRAIIIREILCLFRQYKKQVVEYIVFSIIINSIILIISVKNNLNNFYITGFFIQYFILINVILNYSIENDAKLLEVNPTYSLKILKGEFVFWIVIFCLHLLLISPFYCFFVNHFSYYFLLIFFLSFTLLLLYTLLVRLTFSENEFMRNLMWILNIFNPISIYIFYRRLKC